MNKQRIWLDMTDLSVWSGFMTGVQRVVYQNAKRFDISPDHEAHFFVFDAPNKSFIEVSFSDIQAQIGTAAQESSESATPPSSSIKQRIKRLPRSLINAVPDPVKKRVPHQLKRTIRQGAHLSLRVVRKGARVIRAHNTVPVPAGPQATFMAGDTVLIMGKSWDLPDLIPELGKLKQKQGFRLVHLIHDMIPILEPHLFGPGLFEPYTDCMFEVCSLSDRLLAVSHSTKNDVKRFCDMTGIATPPISVIHLGDDLIDIELEDNEQAPDSRVQSNFILQVGTIEVRKNHLLTYLAYREAALRGIELPQFVMMGGQGWLTDNLLWQITHDPVVKDKIIILTGISDRGRLWLYKNCRFTVSPSTYEGWGMPIGESLAYGKVCITSMTSSTPEVGKELSDYVSPYNSQEMLDTIVKYLDDATLSKREAQIKKEYKIATWDTTYSQVAQAVRI